ncbi:MULTISPECIES: NAD(P)-dependent oxidoreductase [Streptomyces]|uniref:NAD-dependent epimerase/dehydratase domain-containing protein n=1 Tax=Streptomyces luteosporeus TaxID=173856 RepID=A0ABP6GDT1_9ACTN
MAVVRPGCELLTTMTTITERTGTVAVLGATGCVGRSVCDVLRAAGHEVLAVARRPAPHPVADDFVPLDVAAAAPGRIAELLDHHQVVAVVNATGGWDTTEQEMTYAHVDLVDRLVAGCALAGRRMRVVHMGSIHEYGPVPEGTRIDEGWAPAPVTPYGRTKLAGSRRLLAATEAGRVDGVVLRAVNVCGPHTTPASFLGAVLTRLRNRPPGEVLSFDVAEARRDFMDVRDLARAALAAVRVPDPARVVNLGRGEAVPVRDLVGHLLDAAGAGPEAARLKVADVPSKGGSWTCADIRLAARTLGWRPRIPLRDSLRAMWDAAAGTASHREQT